MSRRSLTSSLLLFAVACAVPQKEAQPSGLGLAQTKPADGEAQIASADAPAPAAHTKDPSSMPTTSMPAPPPKPAEPMSASPAMPLGNAGVGVGGGGGGLGLLGGPGVAFGGKMSAEKPARPSRRERELAKSDLPKNEERAYDKGEQGGEAQESVVINDLVEAKKDPLSTFAIDVDTGSYTLARRMLREGGLPQPAAVRVEEWVNAFDYDYSGPTGEHPFSIHMQAAPLAKQSYVMRIGVQGKRVSNADRKPTQLTFLVDTSGSMQGEDRLPLAQRTLKLLVEQLDKRDSVAIATYAGDTRLVLPSTPVTQQNKERILAAIADLRSGGGTAMSSGMELAYREATKGLAEKSISRVIVLSDGDANIGRSSPNEILKSIKGYVSEGVTLSTVGFGMGNYRDEMMERLADAGNGNYTYVDSIDAAKKAFVDNLAGTLEVIAQDTKIQVAMNPDVVKSYRLIGYENRDVRDEDFRNDKVDAGEIGAGHTVTALYEVQLYSDTPSGDIATVQVRYKQPRGTKATEVQSTFTAAMLSKSLEQLDADGRFAVAVGLASESFRNSPHMGRLGLTLQDAWRLASTAAVGPHAKERREFAELLTPFAKNAPVARLGE